MENTKDARSYWAQLLVPIITPIVRSAVLDVFASLPKEAPAPSDKSTPLFLTSEQTKELTGWADSTFRIKVRQMPEGIVIRKSKRLLLHREKFIAWLTGGREGQAV